MLYLQDNHPEEQLFNLCMGNAEDLLPALNNFITIFKKDTNKSLPRVYTEGHGPEYEEEKKLLPIAQKIISDFFPKLILHTFPCSSQYFWDSKVATDYIFDLQVDRNDKNFVLQRMNN